MNTIVNYFIEANLSLILLLGAYWLFLRHENQFSFNRAVLLVSIAFSILFPLLPMQWLGQIGALPSSRLTPANWLPEILVIARMPVTPVSLEGQTGWSLLEAGYLLVTSAFAILFLVRITAIIRLIRKAKKYTWKACLISESNDDQPTFSFFSFIFIGQANRLAPAEKEEILQHELVHVRRHHSADVLMVSFLQIVFWFNPFIRIYKSLLMQLHEFEADAHSVENQDVDGYCRLLAKVTLQSEGFPMVNHFSRSLTIKRINMMKTFKRKIQNWKKLSIASSVVLVMFCVACHNQVMSDPSTEAASAKQSDKIFTIVEQLPTYPGGLPAFQEFIWKNMRYPASARAAHIEGKVLIEFVVNTDGHLSDFKVLEGIEGGCNEEALRVMADFPAWTPGKQDGVPVKTRMVVPFVFSLAAADSGTNGKVIPQDQPYVMKYAVEKESESTRGVKLKGTVLDANGKPLTGTHILLKNTTNGVTVGPDGTFVFETSEKHGTLVFSFVGYKFEEYSF